MSFQLILEPGPWASDLILVQHALRSAVSVTFLLLWIGFLGSAFLQVGADMSSKETYEITMINVCEKLKGIPWETPFL